MVALQALAKYGAATYSPEGSTTVLVTSLGSLNTEFKVNQDNRLLYQEEKLSEIPGEYTIKAQGQSCVLAQVSFHDPDSDDRVISRNLLNKQENTDMSFIFMSVLSALSTNNFSCYPAAEKEFEFSKPYRTTSVLLAAIALTVNALLYSICTAQRPQMNEHD